MAASTATSAEGCANSSWTTSEDEMDAGYVERARNGILEGREQISAGFGIEGTAALRKAIAEGDPA